MSPFDLRYVPCSGKRVVHTLGWQAERCPSRANFVRVGVELCQTGEPHRSKSVELEPHMPRVGATTANVGHFGPQSTELGRFRPMSGRHPGNSANLFLGSTEMGRAPNLARCVVVCVCQVRPVTGQTRQHLARDLGHLGFGVGQIEVISIAFRLQSWPPKWHSNDYLTSLGAPQTRTPRFPTMYRTPTFPKIPRTQHEVLDILTCPISKNSFFRPFGRLQAVLVESQRSSSGSANLFGSGAKCGGAYGGGRVVRHALAQSNVLHETMCGLRAGSRGPLVCGRGDRALARQ